jgi:hypothetical protein
VPSWRHRDFPQLEVKPSQYFLGGISQIDPKNQFAKTPFCDAASIAASARRSPVALHLKRNHFAILTIFSGVNHVDGTPPALAPSAKLV